jgi:septal ring factor EnvC (AmiA/AmiB activator)
MLSLCQTCVVALNFSQSAETTMNMRTTYLSGFLLACLCAGVLVSCQPPAENKTLASEIEQFVSALEQDIAKFDGNQTYLNSEQKTYNEKNAALKKKLGKNDSVYNALTKAHQKLVDEHENKLAALKDLAEASKQLIPKLLDGSFAFDRRLIEEDFKGGTHEGKTFDGFKQKAEKLREELNAFMPRHEALDAQIKLYEQKLDSLERASQVAETASSPQRPKPRRAK